MSSADASQLIAEAKRLKAAAARLRGHDISTKRVRFYDRTNGRNWIMRDPSQCEPAALAAWSAAMRDAYGDAGTGPDYPTWFRRAPPYVSIDDLEEAERLDSKAGDLASQALTIGQKKKRGPKYRYDWNRVRDEAFRIFDRRGPLYALDPTFSLAELVRALSEFMAREFDKEPSPSLMKERAEAFHNEWCAALADN